MTKHAVALALALAFVVPPSLTGCDRTAGLTEEEFIQRAKDFEDKGDLKASIVELKNAIQRNPDNPQARLLLGQVYLKHGMGSEAEKELTQAARLGVSREVILPQLGEALLLTGDYKRVLDEVQPGEQTSKTNRARMLQLRADALLMQGNLSDACNLYRQALEADPNNAPTYWGLARCEVVDDDLAEAKVWLEQALKIKDKQAKTWILVGDLERKANNLPGALAAYTSALASDPSNREALGQRITANLASGQLEAASKDLDQLRKLAPKEPATHYHRALIKHHQKNYAEARNALQEVFKAAPDFAPAVLLAGMNDFALGAYQQAETQAKRYLAYSPNQPDALRLLASIQISQGRTDNALTTLSPLLAPNSSDIPALILAADAHLKRQEFKQATRLLERAAKLDPKNSSIETKLGFARLVSGDTALAVTGLEAASAFDSDQHQSTALLVLTYLSRKDYDKALEAIDALEKRIPNNPLVHNLRGTALFGKNDPANARKSFERALSIDPTFFLAADNLAKLDLREKKPDAARNRYLRILDKDKNNAEAMLALAALAASQRQESEYLRWLEQAATANPKDMRSRTALVKYYLTNKQAQKALDLAKQAVKSNGESPDTLNLLASTLLATGDKAGAISTFERMVQFAPDSPEALMHLALAQVSANQLNGARTNLQKAIRLDPGLIRAQYSLMQLELAEKRYDPALQIARQIQALQPRSAMGFESEADILMAQKKYPQAVKSYELAVGRGSGSMGMIKLHRAYALAGNGSAADRQLKSLLAQYPDKLPVRLYAAEVHHSAGRTPEAIRILEETVKSQPNDVVALNNLAAYYHQTGDGRALATAERAFKLAPGQPVIQDTVGWILVQKGELTRGLDLLSKAAAKSPNSPTIRYHYAVALSRSGKTAEAKRELQEIMNTRKNFPELDAARALLKTL